MIRLWCCICVLQIFLILNTNALKLDSTNRTVMKQDDTAANISKYLLLPQKHDPNINDTLRIPNGDGTLLNFLDEFKIVKPNADPKKNVVDRYRIYLKRKLKKPKASGNIDRVSEQKLVGNESNKYNENKIYSVVTHNQRTGEKTNKFNNNLTPLHDKPNDDDYNNYEYDHIKEGIEWRSLDSTGLKKDINEHQGSQQSNNLLLQQATSMNAAEGDFEVKHEIGSNAENLMSFQTEYIGFEEENNKRNNISPKQFNNDKQQQSYDMPKYDLGMKHAEKLYTFAQNFNSSNINKNSKTDKENANEKISQKITLSLQGTPEKYVDNVIIPSINETHQSLFYAEEKEISDKAGSDMIQITSPTARSITLGDILVENTKKSHPLASQKHLNLYQYQKQFDDLHSLSLQGVASDENGNFKALCNDSYNYSEYQANKLQGRVPDSNSKLYGNLETTTGTNNFRNEKLKNSVSDQYYKQVQETENIYTSYNDDRIISGNELKTPYMLSQPAESLIRHKPFYNIDENRSNAIINNREFQENLPQNNELTSTNINQEFNLIPNKNECNKFSYLYKKLMSVCPECIGYIFQLINGFSGHTELDSQSDVFILQLMKSVLLQHINKHFMKSQNMDNNARITEVVQYIDDKLRESQRRTINVPSLDVKDFYNKIMNSIRVIVDDCDKILESATPDPRIFSTDKLLNVMAALERSNQMQYSKQMFNLYQIIKVIMQTFKSKTGFNQNLYAVHSINKNSYDPVEKYVYNLLREEWLQDILLHLYLNNYNADILNKLKSASYLTTYRFPVQLLIGGGEHFYQYPDLNGKVAMQDIVLIVNYLVKYIENAYYNEYVSIAQNYRDRKIILDRIATYLLSRGYSSCVVRRLLLEINNLLN